MIVRYGTPAMLWAALCSFAKQEAVHFLPSPTHADEGGPALGPLYLRPFPIRPLLLTMAEGADPSGLQSDFVCNPAD
ncbi:MAG: hypothetical protein KGK00_08685, partial [Paracoccaceae bacterium]|nr:hypothetical protein [Paracoccaceae bacterium]